MRNFFQPAALARLAVAGLALMASAGLASAQIYIERPAPPRYYPAPQYSPQPYNPYYQQPAYDPYAQPRRPRRQAAMGSVCVTSRGECTVGRYVPLGTGCKCQIPGFGRKRGQVDY